ncbi:hypothetical protein NKR19_g5320 [Coniochaeta hoffmannii]|uniref:PD-(D/E)XK nuclease-like domain-containing protein n=1 Tax=Coniochaeta hoffmannii TaxID=91930 RepID=A0AA38RI49_9PEZI|nr:hypothetical protein NKR19_g5320 [Coniochaeta hoffmannii]
MHPSHQDPRRLFVEQWLASVELVDDHHSHVDTAQRAISHKRKRHDSADVANDTPFQAIMSTPPPSHGPGSASPPKKRKTLPERGRDAAGDPFMDPDATPRRQGSSLFGSDAPQLPHPSIASSSNPPSSATSDSQARSVRSRATARSTSPTKKMQSLLALRKPILPVSLEEGELPSDISELYDRLLSITDEHRDIFPAVVRDEINKAAGSRRRFPDSWFRMVEARTDRAVPATAATDAELPAPTERQAAEAAAEFVLLQKIKSRAIECRNLAMSEAAWNLEVHGPLLEHALGPCPHVRRHLVTSAQIAKPFVPLMADHALADFAEKKMVDFVLVLDNRQKEQDAAGRDGAAVEEAMFGRLGEDIRRVVQSQPNDCQTINQTSYTPLWYQPAGVSIETKASSSSAEEGRTQLAIWAAAWHQRIESLWMGSGRMTREKRVITLPLLLITEHDWNLSFACDRGDRIEIMGDVTLGDTKSLKGVYTLVAAVCELGRWMEGPFAQWMAEILAEA